MIFAFKNLKEMLKEMLNPKSPIRRQHQYSLDLRGLIWLKKDFIFDFCSVYYILFHHKKTLLVLAYWFACSCLTSLVAQH